MTRICGIEIKSSEALLVVLEYDNNGIQFIDIEPRKIKLGNDESSESLKSFCDSVVNFTRDNHIDTIVIKKRAKKGAMAGGAISFKIETIIQLNRIADVSFISGQGISAANKRDPFQIPKTINKYQETAFMAASLYIRQH